MTLWFVLALMTAAAVFAVLWPLGRRAPARTGSDVDVYRDQLAEIDRDRAAGLIGEREAEAARVGDDGAAPAHWPHLCCCRLALQLSICCSARRCCRANRRRRDATLRLRSDRSRL